MNRLFIIIIIFINALIAFGQDKSTGENISSFPDTLNFFKPTNNLIIQTLDSVKGKIFDSIANPKAYIIKVEKDESWLIALMKQGKFILFDPFENSSVYAQSSDFTFKRQDFNGKGNEELIIQQEFYAGHSGWENSIHERNRGILIWDLDNLTRLMDFDDYHSFQNWWSTYAPDSTGTLDYPEREVTNSGGEYECVSYIVKIAKYEVTIQQNNNCADVGDDKKYAINDPKIHTYILTKTGLVRKN